MSSPRATTLIVGGGIGGLSTAIHLAAADRDPATDRPRPDARRIIVLESAPTVGGKLGEVREAGFRWDTGPSVLTMRHVFEDLFERAGRRMADHLELLPIDPLTRYHWSDGSVLPLDADPDALAAGLERFAAGSAEQWRAFLDYAARLHDLTAEPFIYGDPPSLKRLHRLPLLDALRIDPLRTMDAAIAGHVQDARLRQLLGRFATYVGGSPYRAPATLNVIAHVELAGGVWYPRGGLRAVADALADLARDLGVEIRTHSPVAAVTFGRRAARRPSANGVRLAKGEHVPADSVVLNVDVTTACRNLLADLPAARRLSRRLARAEPSLSGFVLLLGVEDRHPELAHHNIFFAEDYRAEFEAIAAGRLPEDPTIYLAITSRSDPEHAPSGHANYFILVNAAPMPVSNEAPPRRSRGELAAPEERSTDPRDWQAFRDRILARLADHGVDVRGRILVEQRITPAQIEIASGAWRGALYGPSPNDRWSAFRRVPNRFPGARGLYLAGGTTHPGGGVPMVTLSGAVAARQLQEDGL